MTMLRVGVLAIQGAFAEHTYSLKRASKQLSYATRVQIIEVRKPSDLEELDGLILPGGESTTLSFFLKKEGFQETLTEWIHERNGRPTFTWGTCAGLILLANQLEDTKIGGQEKLGGMDVTVNRNAYGRQNQSFETSLNLICEDIKNEGPNDFHGVFIRAPGIHSVDSECVTVLATHTMSDGGNRPVAVQQGHLMATAFHPELTDDYRWHLYFIKQVAAQTDFNINKPP